MAVRKKKSTWTIFREGEFTANLIPYNQCGLRGQSFFRFACEVRCHNLDEQQFVVDQFKVAKCFEQWQKGDWQASCEQLVGGAVRIIHKLMKGRAIYIRVRVMPTNVAGAQFEWHEGEPLPSTIPVKVGQSIHCLSPELEAA